MHCSNSDCIFGGCYLTCFLWMVFAFQSSFPKYAAFENTRTIFFIWFIIFYFTNLQEWFKMIQTCTSRDGSVWWSHQLHIQILTFWRFSVWHILVNSIRTTLQVMRKHPKSVLTSTTPLGWNTDRSPSSRFSTFFLHEIMQTVPASSHRTASTIPRNTPLTSTHPSTLKSLFMDTGKAFNRQHFIMKSNACEWPFTQMILWYTVFQGSGQ